jgi:hypothetical protein
LFDQPFLALDIDSNVVSWTANAETYEYGNGSTIDALLPAPVYTGLGPSPNATDLDHCGAWLNAAWFDGALLHGYYHQEWQCDYANNFMTNKSIGYAVSDDGGRSFSKPGHPNNAIITAPNTTLAHQSGEGDHGVMQMGEFLMLYFRDWQGFNGAATISVARANASTGGVPGSWWKLYRGSFDSGSPGLGGASDMLNNITGTAVYPFPLGGGLVSVGTDGTGHPTLAFSLDGVGWQRAEQPLLYVEPGNWNRSVQPSLELFGYWSLSGPRGATDLSGPRVYAFATYWPPASEERYLVRRPVDLYADISIACGSAHWQAKGTAPTPAAVAAHDGLPGLTAGSNANPSESEQRVARSSLRMLGYTAPATLVALSDYSCGCTGGQRWTTSGVVLPESNCSIRAAAIGYLMSSDTMGVPQPAPGNGSLVALFDCAVSAVRGAREKPVDVAGQTLDHIITTSGECVAAFNGTETRHVGFGWASTYAECYGDDSTSSSLLRRTRDGVSSAASGAHDRRVPPTLSSPLPSASTFIGDLFRCVNATTGTHFATFNDETCRGETLDRRLAYIYAPLLPGKAA